MIHTTKKTQISLHDHTFRQVSNENLRKNDSSEQHAKDRKLHIGLRKGQQKLPSMLTYKNNPWTGQKHL